MNHPGKQISRLRKLHGLTQEEFASKSNVSRAYLARIETERQMPTIETLSKFADILLVPTGILLMGGLNTSIPAHNKLHNVIEKLITSTIIKDISTQT